MTLQPSLRLGAAVGARVLALSCDGGRWEDASLTVDVRHGIGPVPREVRR